MRIIHTGDWHIGQALAGYGRDHEHRLVLAGLARIAQQREADALIIAGDVFDHQNPSGEAQRLFYDTLIALKRARPAMTVVVTAGNHDAAGRLEAPKALLEGMGVHVVGSVRRLNGRIEARRHLIALPAANGDIAAHVLAVSYPTAACLPPLATLADREGTSPIVEATRALYADLMQATGAGRDGLPLIVTGHLHVAGGIESSGAERHILVGGQHAVPPSVFPNEAAYVALGHLHKPQCIGRDGVRYSGSLLPLSATELSYRHGVTLVTLDGRTARTEEIPIARPVPFLRLPAHGDMRLDELADRLKALDLEPGLDADWQPFVQIWLAREALPTGYRAAVDQIAGKFPVRVVDPRVSPPPATVAQAGCAERHVRLAELKPVDLFRQAFERAHARPPGSAHLDAFHASATAALEDM